ncbi:hypothetical protein [Pedobacter sp.]
MKKSLLNYRRTAIRRRSLTSNQSNRVFELEQGNYSPEVKSYHFIDS